MPNMKRSQSDLAEELGVTQTHISLILSGKRRPGPDLAAQMGRVLGINPMRLIYYDRKGVIRAYRRWARNNKAKEVRRAG